jgi:hypothetical protein
MTRRAQPVPAEEAPRLPFLPLPLLAAASPALPPAGPTSAGPDRVAFPDSGHIGYTAFGALARANLPHPQRDLGLVGADFRHFLAKRQIPADALNIEQIFATFCARQTAAS